MLLFTTVAAASRVRAGAAKVDITPPHGFPMWGYASRKDKPCTGTLDPLHARALVLKAGDGKIALVSLDLGRAPTRESMKRIRDSLKNDGFAELFLVGSHTHHGPVIEIDSWPNKEKSYVRDLEAKTGRRDPRCGQGAQASTLWGHSTRCRSPQPAIEACRCPH